MAGEIVLIISPGAKDSDPVAITQHVAAELDRRGIAYLHVMRGDFFGVQQGDVVTPARAAFKGALIANMGYTPAEGAAAVAAACDDSLELAL